MAPNDATSQEEPFPWHLGIYDAHCHPTEIMSSLVDLPKMKAKVLTIMSSRRDDLDLIAQAAEQYGVSGSPLFDLGEANESDGCTILPSFGWHPWFSHQLYDDTEDVGESPSAKPNKLDHYRNVLTPSPSNEHAFIDSLPEPMALSGLLAQVRDYLTKYPEALVGEVGLDRSFRIPDNRSPPTKFDEGVTPGGRRGRPLSPYHVDMNHQRKILRAQLHLAGELRRAVSLHGVAAHGVLFETLQRTWKGHEVESRRKREQRVREQVVKPLREGADGEGITSSKPYPPRICLHSYTGSADLVKQYLNPAIPAVIFFSFSQAINFSQSDSASTRCLEAMKVVPDDRILVESDLHTAGERMDELLEEMVRSICKVKAWQLELGVKQLAKNWRHFALGVVD
jgi:Tat protein secretion system quality control protein TatD with DNase activity